ncbi:hypothetical protein Desdi_3470 [Desulfitobacterium dichloroeliminans LMG P-21439]|uniref:DUF1934 domain-containing protein n=1 Tax=Desulfitobacterium dichloroeliminans (strain LMG P-21439 / DCA1) TaxID=871963 RepID=L0FDX3_DESDL|nr:DUF1934 domain-containing protein [Desulfitobacterium dichloroeliminans]AGA70856.1 hypothetical protein Desdi_3470 [Desulfitobacterium dichloroeliminans LMG P-21439]
MTDKVLIQVSSTQHYPEGHNDHMEFTTVGTFHHRAGAYYIIYRDTEITGMDGVTTSLKIEPTRVSLNRMGAIDHKQIFERGIRHGSSYVTPQGSLFLEVETKEMEIHLTELEGNITLKYDLFSGDQLVSHNRLRINIKEDAPQ